MSEDKPAFEKCGDAEVAQKDRTRRSRLVESVYDSLQREIRTGHLAGLAYLPAETSLASEYGTSRSTIRQAVDRLASAGLVVKRPNSSPAIVHSPTSVHRRTSHEVLVWISHPMHDPSALAFLKGVSKGLLGSRYRLVVREPRRHVGSVVCADERLFIQELLSRQDWDGAILWRDAFATHDDLWRALGAQGRPLVFVDIPPPQGVAADFVGTSNAAAAQTCTEHLLGIGHSRVSFVADTDIPETTRERIRGYRRAMHHAGLGEFADVVIAGDLEDQPGYRAPESAASKTSRYFATLANRAVRRLLTMAPRPTGICVVHDVFARSIVARLEAAGVRVPADMSVVGFDWLAGTDLALPDDLTTAAQGFEEFGFQSACLFLDRICGELPASPRYVLVNAPLVIRSSTAPDLSLPFAKQAAIVPGQGCP